ncbi:NAD(P)H-dependent oxidoreductase subunit E [Varunaivibrio sulfuroxidans]|uniref:NAD-dependent formate dehydrogenase flavoprotein subunit n=1 Tax=Varunaivibrio sulfuroxidans TaxID=1773489 RepID=A0A4R3JBT5_9PROT|nr:NAD(P)H-dependent oxidoreductase subunit E [Varunaivibrio sulfuroxidans]TCS62523.1 NAD-dependent formate dehydrogenase flavoprotein subunit [Varunaivibrio sulfuroxidans]WES30806.1 NAD(P)H-dependent oxidoreductase subunit E [Varunaivibrio sulfuroxidans]
MDILDRSQRRKFFPKGRQGSDAAEARVRALLEGRSLAREELIENLHVVQDAHGAIEADHLAALAEVMKLSQAEVYEVASFYAHFDVSRPEQKRPPLKIRVCNGPACRMAGSADLLDALCRGLADRAEVVGAPCVGGCDHAPMAMVGRRRIGRAQPKNLREMVDRAARTPEIPSFEKLDAYLAAGGYGALKACRDGRLSRGEILAQLDLSDLRGLGGAGFSVARKWRFLDGAAKPRAVVVNADEGEPGTFKDRHVLETHPHRVIEGALLAAWVVEAADVYIYLRDEYSHLHAFLGGELDRLREQGVTGDVAVHLRRGAGAYVCGEESALLESIEGKRGLPRNRPPFPAEVGLFGRPTLINNVETLYWVRDIVTTGGQDYLDRGRPHYYSVSGRVNDPGVKLAPAGISARRLIEDYCGGMAEGHTLKAFLPGGASGGILPADLADLALDFGTLEPYGCFVGSSALIVLSAADDVRDIVDQCLSFFAGESCGQCTPCRVGIGAMQGLLDDPRANRTAIEDLAGVMRDGSICGLGQAAPNTVLCAYRYFPEVMT